MAEAGGQKAPQKHVGFWKIRHFVIGLAGLAVITLIVLRGCGGDDDEKDHAESADHGRRQAVAVPVPQTGQQRSVVSGYPQSQQQPGYGYQQQPPYGYAQQPQSVYPPQPSYGYGQPQMYGYAQQPQSGYQPQPSYGYDDQQQAQQPQSYQQQPYYGYAPQYTVPDSDNPWAVAVPGYGQYPHQAGSQPWVQGGQQLQAPQWGQPQRQAPVYIQQPSGGPQYRPLEQESRPAPRSAPAPAQPWAVRPYDRRGGSSFNEGGGAGAYPYGTGYGGYYGAPYGLPGVWSGGYGAGWPTLGYPSIGWPMVW